MEKEIFIKYSLICVKWAKGSSKLGWREYLERHSCFFHLYSNYSLSRVSLSTTLWLYVSVIRNVICMKYKCNNLIRLSFISKLEYCVFVWSDTSLINSKFTEIIVFLSKNIKRISALENGNYKRLHSTIVSIHLIRLFLLG